MSPAKAWAATAVLGLAAALLSGCARGVVSYEGYDYSTASPDGWGYTPSSCVREEESSGPGLLDLFFAVLLTSLHDDDPDVVVIHDGGGRHGGWGGGGGGGGSRIRRKH